jgi:hypothetical protein
MRVFLPNDMSALTHAKEWFNDTRLKLLLRDFEMALHLGEARWGECLVFIEVDAGASKSSRARQIDLLVSFQDRAALIEFKGVLSGQGTQ